MDEKHLLGNYFERDLFYRFKKYIFFTQNSSKQNSLKN